MIAEGIKYSRSIDNYVHSHSDKEAVKTVAKIAIVQTILDAERACHISIDPQVHPPRFKDERRAHKSWLSDFFTVLQDGIVESKNLDEIFDNLTIINFNYDRCIEHYLFHVMHRLYPSKGEGHLTGLLNQKLKILHPYGLVGNLPWQSRTKFCSVWRGRRQQPRRTVESNPHLQRGSRRQAEDCRYSRRIGRGATYYVSWFSFP